MLVLEVSSKMSRFFETSNCDPFRGVYRSDISAKVCTSLGAGCALGGSLGAGLGASLGVIFIGTTFGASGECVYPQGVREVFELQCGNSSFTLKFSLYLSLYIYIYRERERERAR